MEYIEIEYNQDLKALDALLSDVKRPGDFFVAGTMEIPMPRVEVKDAGTLSFPIPGPQIEALVQHATQAPYGRGEETVVDTSVRNVWQIAPTAVKISGKSWAANFENILLKVTAGLGCHDVAVSAELYKLLVYDRGGFFLPHRDTEKTARMFGTLVVTLPSAYRGGALRIRHGEREVTVEADATDPSEISFTAFYADCEHEVLPVEEGSRVCLVYNLVQKSAKRKTQVLESPNYESHVAKVAAMFEEYWNSPNAPAKIAWLLDHQYSPAGLAFSSLKGTDAAKSQVLVQASAQAQCVVHLGVVHIEETGGAEEHYDPYGSRGRRYGDYANDDEEEDSLGEDVSFSAITVDDGWQYVDEWRDTEDRVVEFGRIPLAKGELLPAGALDKEPPDTKRLTEASGNEGATYERSYHRAALVLWPANRMIDVLLQGGVVATLPYLNQLAAGGKSTHSKAMAAARRIVQAWRTSVSQDRYSIGIKLPGSSSRTTMIAALIELNSPALIEKFIREVVLPAYDGSEKTALLTAAVALGNKKAAEMLAALMEARMADRPNGCAELLLALGVTNPPPSFRLVAKAAVEGIDGIGIPGRKAVEPNDEDFWWKVPEDIKKQKVPPELITNLFSALTLFYGRTLHDAAVGKISSRLEVFDPVTVVVPAIERMCAEQPPAIDSVVQHLWTSAAEFLLLRSDVPPQPPPDWHLQATLSCSCPDCADLQTFARDPSEQAHRFRINKERRRHLHQVIKQYGLDMTHVTERVGSPQTLVCTKDRRTFQARMKEYRKEIAAMRKLMKLADQSAAATALSKRMEAAVKASTT